MAPTIQIQHARSVKDTLRMMVAMVRTFRMDMILWASHDILSVFNAIKKLPWREDRWNDAKAEVVKRPWFTMQRMWPGGDCDDKAVALASVLSLQGVPWRFCAVGKRPGRSPSHVLVEADFGKGWMPLDATYPHNFPGYTLSDYPVKVRL